MINYKEKGMIVEQSLILELLKRGYKVSKPVIDNYSYDILVDSGTKISKVQVKSTSTNYKGYKSGVTAYAILLAQGSKGKTKYPLEEVDIFACYIEPCDLWYFIANAADLPIKVTLFAHKPNSKEKHFGQRDNYTIFD